MAQCKFCGKQVTWMVDGRKKVPVDGDGTTHECENYKNARDSIKRIEPTAMDPDLIKQYEQAINDRANKHKKK
jgi:hypothetical protein